MADTEWWQAVMAGARRRQAVIAGSDWQQASWQDPDGSSCTVAGRYSRVRMVGEDVVFPQLQDLISPPLPSP